MANGPGHMLLIVLPLLVLASDIYSHFLKPHAPPSSPPHHHHVGHPQKEGADHVIPPRPPSFGAAVADPTSLGGRFHISFCSSCSYKKTALETRTALMQFFPGTNVALSNYPPPLLKRLLIKAVPLVQVAGIAFVVAGDHIFPRLGYASPPHWYNSVVRSNRFGTAAGLWVIGNVLQNTLQSTGAFEVFYDGDLIFSKLKEGRFPADFELRELAAKTQELKAQL
ncbi:hypothetical protein KP509_35G037100 [Ceratopteris richardii]|uniref:SelT-like protein n=1 Tax=Ceratopteris richardii TaxID=49495 RepID=A0A8T2QG32_CERRI|nr:hypothetical protein KP509_35G037100 [Ceratopteris richardii]